MKLLHIEGSTQFFQNRIRYDVEEARLSLYLLFTSKKLQKKVYGEVKYFAHIDICLNFSSSRLLWTTGLNLKIPTQFSRFVIYDEITLYNIATVYEVNSRKIRDKIHTVKMC